MNKLVSANFSRLAKDKVFWINAVLIFALSAAFMLNGVRQAKAMAGDVDYDGTLDSYYFNMAPMIGIFIAIFVALFLGTEYSDGTIRNKLVVGHERTDIYLSNWVVCFAGGLVFLAAWFIGGLTGLPYFGGWEIGVKGLALYCLIGVCFIAALTGIFVMISMLSSNKAITAVIEIILFLGLLIGASMMYNALCEPETVRGMVMTDKGLQMAEPSVNPYYISGNMRKLYKWAVDVLPTGQGILMANLEIVHPVREIISSLLITGGTWVLGIFAFRRKDIK